MTVNENRTILVLFKIVKTGLNRGNTNLFQNKTIFFNEGHRQIENIFFSLLLEIKEKMRTTFI